MKNSTQINCPECGTQIDVNDLLKHQLEDTIRKEFQAKAAEDRKQLQARERELDIAKTNLDTQIKEATKKVESELRTKIKSELAEESSEQLKLLQEELKEKSEKIRDLNKANAEISRLRREKDELRSSIEAESAEKLNAALKEAQEKAIQKAEADQELKIRELQKQLEDQKRLTAEMKRKQEQGSMQLQGEALELAIEEWLAASYPLDTVDEVKKGANGADCLQVVHTREHQNCGKIYYESKRTKAFQPSWIEKFKNDIREKGADIGVLVTEAMPAGMDRMGMMEGIWICSFDEFKGLSAVLRQSVIQLNHAVASQENKGDKMVMLYDFLTSNEFRLQIEAIVEGFSQMQEDLQKEKNAMKRLWKKREKQIEKVVSNTVHMHGAIKGIAGNSVQSVKALELNGHARLESDEQDED